MEFKEKVEKSTLLPTFVGAHSRVLQNWDVQIPDFLKKSGILAFTHHLGLLY
jgi:hypothetical protein